MNDRIQPEVADGEPSGGDLGAVVDESSPQNAAGGVSYVVAVAAMFDPTSVLGALDGLFTADRQRPFHWEREGLVARERIIEIASEAEVVATAYYSHVARRGQKHARTEMIGRIARRAADDGVDHLIIEASDQATIGRDQHAILQTFDGVGGAPYSYDWRSKSERLLWIADAIAGAASEFVTASDSTWADKLVAAGVLTIVSHP